jgi:hypothetical protein
MNYYTNGSVAPDDRTDLMGWYRIMWDDDYFYGLFYTADETLWDNNTDPWTNDSWEIYFDSDNSKLPQYDGVNDNQIRFEHKDVAPADLDDSFSDATVLNIEFAQKDTLNGYILEFKIPLQDIKLDPIPGTVFGWEAQQNDNDGQPTTAPAREHISKWWLQSGDISWNTPSVLGEAMLVDEEVGDNLKVYKTGTAPTIDGFLDDVWYANSRGSSMNSYFNGTLLPDSYEDLQGEYRVMWDDDYFYGFFSTRDDVLWDLNTDPWTNDSWEIYFDSDNSKLPQYDNVDDNQIRFEHKDVAPTDLDDSFGDASVANIEFVQVDHDDGLGYDLEFKIPLSDLKLDAIEGTVFGWEVQQNDNDGQPPGSPARDHISKWYLDSGDNSWNNPSVLGNAELAGALVVGVDEKEPVAREYALRQNYPNPFNPGTTISYTLKSDGKVRLAVYDLMGREVAVLVDGVQAAGRHEVSFSGADLPSGVYFYRIVTANNEVITRRMALIK